MNKPLKNKKYTHTSIQNKPLWTCYPEHEIKSAVEWLKKQFVHLPNCNTKMGFKNCNCDYSNVIGVIDEAFPNLMVKEIGENLVR